jgi:catechol 1,2-dioxygenase
LDEFENWIYRILNLNHMKRRIFIKKSSLTALSISIFGAIHWNGNSFVGDSPTTTDILGPFYRPGTPLRNNIIPLGSKGIPLHLSGVIFMDNGKATLDNALIEIWQCNENQEYDNSSDDYLYRGALRTGKDGKYNFTTIIPVPYKANPADESSWRPAHIHIRVSSPLQQDLITQIYFKGDKYIDTDTSSSAPESINRILEIKTNAKNEKQVVFDVIMSKSFPLDDQVYKKIEGLYRTDEKVADSERIFEFIRNDDILFMKLKGQLVAGLKYVGENTFEGGMGYPKVKFDLRQGGIVKASIEMRKAKFFAEKFLKYSE